MSSATGKAKRRHRADLRGFAIRVSGAEAPDAAASAYRALATAFHRWLARTGRIGRSPEAREKTETRVDNSLDRSARGR